ncbi:MAG: hypothetical protein HY006_02795 [Candidatus Sungbacteria bacterium]|nr:hypothetical protein [Candidatus Sungbacteria bacterium]
MKIIFISPANPLVSSLLEKTMPFITFNQFIFWFGMFEVLVGVLFLLPKLEKIALTLLGLHLITTFMPLVMVPSVTWQGWFVPTLEGQYIIKNILIISCAFSLATRTILKRRGTFFR